MKTAYETVMEWLHQHGECPTSGEFRLAIVRLADLWAEDTANGMDVLASSRLDTLEELAAAMRELV